MIINNITSAFAHNGVPVANGTVTVYVDNTSALLANLTVNGVPAPNPARLNSNGGLGHAVECELSSAYCVVKNAQGAVLFSYRISSNWQDAWEAIKRLENTVKRLAAHIGMEA